MFCTKCGKEIDPAANFCAKCGEKVQNNSVPEKKPQMAAGPLVSIPVVMKAGVFNNTEPYVVLMDEARMALIHIEKERYKAMVAAKNQGGGFLDTVFDMMATLRDYAKELSAKSIEKGMEENPGSLLIDNSQIKRLKIFREYNFHMKRHENHETFELHVAGKKYEGAIELTVNTDQYSAFFTDVLGTRYN